MSAHRVRHPGRVLAVVVVLLLVAAAMAALTLNSRPGRSPVGAGTAPTAEAATGVPVVLNPRNSSGISGRVVYGTRVTGTASGMDPAVAATTGYYSFVYGAGSDSTGDNPCILTGELGAGLGALTTVGRWRVDSDGTGTLDARAPVPAAAAGTMSIRVNNTGTSGLIGPTPLDGLVACGDVGPDKRTPLGDVQNQLPPLPKVVLPQVSLVPRATTTTTTARPSTAPATTTSR